jgi:hypothetical protein
MTAMRFAGCFLSTTARAGMHNPNMTLSARSPVLE